MKILVIGAHPDDEAYGCGGAIARLAGEGHEVHALIVTEGSTAQYPDKKMIVKKRDEALEVGRILGIKGYSFGDFADMRLDTVPHVELNGFISKNIRGLKPDWIFTHSPLDMNKDHQIVFESTMVAARPSENYIKKIISYEVPSSSELGRKPFSPNLFMDITNHFQKKVDAIRAYASELREYPHGRSVAAVEALARYRGYSSGHDYAEAFTIIREIL